MSKRKTHKEYVDELAIKNPTVKAIEQYIDSKTKIEHHCLIHEVYWKTSPSSTLKGCGCFMCLKEKIALKNSRTHKEYIQEVAEINPDIIVLGEYMGVDTPILHGCLMHDVEWMTCPKSILRGCGCKQCGIEKSSNARRKTHEQYTRDLKIVNPNINVIESYKGANIPIAHRCKIDGYIWRITPANVLYGKGCSRCAGNIKKTHEEYVNEVAIINSNIEVLGVYVGANIPIAHRCKIDGYIWEVTPSAIYRGRGCPCCANHIKKTHEEYVNEVAVANANVKVVGRYINYATPLLHKCLIHNVEWMAHPSSILHGCGCEECRKEKIGNKLRKPQEKYELEVAMMNPDIEVVGIYINANTPILHRCRMDGYEWLAAPANILYGYGCPRCNESSGERRVRQWLDKNNIQYEYQKPFEDCRDINLLPFDFYLEEHNIVIEYQGEQHYRPIEYFGGKIKFKLQQKHDNIKRQYCKNNNIKLLEIPYYANVEEELNNFLFI